MVAFNMCIGLHFSNEQGLKYRDVAVVVSTRTGGLGQLL